jgi:putative Holliday junction resolvase
VHDARARAPTEKTSPSPRLPVAFLTAVRRIDSGVSRLHISGVRVLGLDVGSRTIGVAASDELGLAAHPVRTIRRQGTARDVATVLALCRERAADQVVVGLPYDLEGRVGPRAERVLVFVRALQAAGGPPVETWDERFSTIAADEQLRAAEVSARRRKAVIDQAAAVVILQDWIDARAAKGAPCPPST